ncbi:pyrimidine reductase family protein [Spiractinospora alimapuensis]|uniref:pyrimidine reductase family protein n=1 Tax=Spiractinospora alimapuensis TaxID=2820884 RepID=UPI00374459F4
MSDTPTLQRLIPQPGVGLAPTDVYAYPVGLDRPWVRANMVSSVDGAAWDAEGRSRGLSSAADRAVLAALRGLSDVVVVGAATARTEGYRPVRPREVWAGVRAGRPRTPRIAVVTRGLDIHPELWRDAPEDARTVVLTTERAPRERRAEMARHADVVVAGETDVEPSAAVAALAELGLSRVLCEGGPRLLAEFSAADVVDELCLTLSPTLCGGDAPRILSGGATTTHRLTLSEVLTAEDALFLRYLRPQAASATPVD